MCDLLRHRSNEAPELYIVYRPVLKAAFFKLRQLATYARYLFLTVPCGSLFHWWTDRYSRRKSGLPRTSTNRDSNRPTRIAHNNARLVVEYSRLTKSCKSHPCCSYTFTLYEYYIYANSIYPYAMWLFGIISYWTEME